MAWYVLWRISAVIRVALRGLVPVSPWRSTSKCFVPVGMHSPSAHVESHIYVSRYASSPQTSRYILLSLSIHRSPSVFVVVALTPCHTMSSRSPTKKMAYVAILSCFLLQCLTFFNSEPDYSDQYMSPLPKRYFTPVNATYSSNTHLCSRKRPPTHRTSTTPESDGGNSVDSVAVHAKRLKKAEPGSPEYAAMWPVTIT